MAWLTCGWVISHTVPIYMICALYDYYDDYYYLFGGRMDCNPRFALCSMDLTWLWLWLLYVRWMCMGAIRVFTFWELATPWLLWCDMWYDLFGLGIWWLTLHFGWLLIYLILHYDLLLIISYLCYPLLITYAFPNAPYIIPLFVRYPWFPFYIYLFTGLFKLSRISFPAAGF